MIRRLFYTALGLTAAAIGGIGIVVPGLPSTVFFIIAAWAFAKSNPRLEAWVLGLPGVGVAVSDYRDGLGMPARAKATASIMLIVAVVISAGFALENPSARLAIAALGLVGLYWINVRVPTKR